MRARVPEPLGLGHADRGTGAPICLTHLGKGRAFARSRVRVIEDGGMRIELFVDDPVASVVFYTGVLGFSVVGRDAEAGYTSLELEGSRVSIQSRAWLPEGHPLDRDGAPGCGVEIVLPVADVCVRHAGALAAGAKVTDLVDQAWGQTDFRLQDPDGFYLRVTSE